MPLVTLTLQDLPAYGAPLSEVTMTAMDAAGVEFVNDGNTILLINNASAGAENVTAVGRASNRSFNHAIDQVIATTNTKPALCGPFPQELFNDSGGKVQLTIADATSMTCAAVRLNKTPSA
jgi:hypothetical protein